MLKLTNILSTIFVVLWIFIVPISLGAQQRVVISPFYSDFAILDNSVPADWSISPYIQLGVKVKFPPNTTFDSLKQYKFENNLYFNSVLHPFFPVVLQCGQLRWHNQNFTNWNIPNLNVQERNYIETTGGQISLSYNDCSYISGNLTNKRDIPSFTYIHYEGWGTLFPINLQRADTTIYSLQINPSLFYLLTDKGMVDLYATENIVIPPHEKLPSIFLFYKPIYEHKVVQYKGIKVDLLLEDEKLAEQLFKRTNSDTIGKASRKELVYHPDTISDDSLLYRSLYAIDKFAKLSDTDQKHIAIAKTGLNFMSTMGKENMADTITATFSLTLDSVLLVDNEMYRNQTLIHELLHFIVGKRKVLPKELSAQANNFLNESTVEYLAKYIYGKYISKENLFVDSLRNSSIKSSIIKKAKRSIRANKTVSVGLKSDESANTAWVYYDLLPNLLHQLAVYSQVSEEEFASAVFRYLKDSKQPQSLQNFLIYMKDQGLDLQEKQTRILWYLLKN